MSVKKAMKLDAEQMLGVLADMRRKIPFLNEGAPRRAAEDGRTRFDGMPLETAEDFEWAAVVEGIESLADDLSATIERKRAEAMAMAMRIYYAAEEASHDPANAHLIELVEKMRAAYEKHYGRPIPPKGKK